MSDAQKALPLAKKIEQCAGIIAARVQREISIQCDGRPEFEAIILEAVERKIMTMRHEASLRAARVRP